MRQLLQNILKIFAKLILLKYKPEIIGITGSLGKTSAKEAVYCVLKEKFQVAKTMQNYNNEIGLPLTVIGNIPLSSAFSYIKILYQAVILLLILDRHYPKILVLEMAADKPGDIRYLTDIAKPSIGIITAIGNSHLEKFKIEENIRREKASLVREMAKDHWAILNIDDKKVESVAKETKAKIISYGLSDGANVQAKEIRIKFGAGEAGVGFKIVYNGSAAPVFLNNVLSRAGIYAALAGAAVGVIKGMNLVEISQALKGFQSPNGRLKIISGIKNTIIIDDTYNAAPASSLLALETLASLPNVAGKRYAVFGDMLELGSLSVAGHETVGRAAVKEKIDKLIVVGERSRDIARGAKQAGMKDDDVFHFAENHQAAEFLAERLKPGDVVLIKGSQDARMEKVVEALMAEPLRAKELLVRQGKKWAGKK
ncbi:MAG: UDP-N-acetylmuramoyl-tripeptide--D-alanyl-D-alanine ligase [Patescibacteria group bacterium]|nr:UDP-N-acetylmuramoyl-tripeptide--D-alanyl-D-alanine ligase [Patescibacteria group bacterium]